MAKWFHKVDLEWLQARQNYLSATDIKQLLPVTKTGRERKVTDEDYLKVKSSKMVKLTEADCESTGPAARGHILEPYAIEMFNEAYGQAIGETLYHWDDVVCASFEGVLGFSPDALNFKQDPDIVTEVVLTDVEYIGEVKSYGPDRHLACGYTPKEKLEERWQIAAAMATYPSIDHAWLIFYNPSMVMQMFVVRYGREELADEIDICLQIAEKWYDFNRRFDSIEPAAQWIAGSNKAEDEIIDEIIAHEGLNPNGQRSVMR